MIEATAHLLDTVGTRGIDDHEAVHEEASTTVVGVETASVRALAITVIVARRASTTAIEITTEITTDVVAKNATTTDAARVRDEATNAVRVALLEHVRSATHPMTRLRSEAMAVVIE